MPGAVLGVITLKYLERHLGSDFETVIYTLLAVALLLSGAALLARVLMKATDGEHSSAPLTHATTTQAIVLGAFVGLVIGLTSAGSGALIAVGLVIWFRLKPARVVGTDLFHASIVLWAAAIAHVFANAAFAVLLAGAVGHALGGGIGGLAFEHVDYAAWRRIVQSGGATTSVATVAADLAGDFTTELGGKTLGIMYEALAG